MMGPTLGSLVVGLAVLALTFGALERWRPAARLVPRSGRARVTDALYWVVMPFVNHALTRANVPWSFGPLRRVLASPAFHRWHHSADREGIDKNFAGLFAFYDVLFGTFYMPEGRQPERFGWAEGEAPDGFVAQMTGPFRGA